MGKARNAESVAVALFRYDVIMTCYVYAKRVVNIIFLAPADLYMYGAFNMHVI